jgi:hypothetical protein
MDWLLNQFVILGGIPFQNWMLRVLAAILVASWSRGFGNSTLPEMIRNTGRSVRRSCG